MKMNSIMVMCLALATTPLLAQTGGGSSGSGGTGTGGGTSSGASSSGVSSGSSTVPNGSPISPSAPGQSINEPSGAATAGSAGTRGTGITGTNTTGVAPGLGTNTISEPNGAGRPLGTNPATGGNIAPTNRSGTINP